MSTDPFVRAWQQQRHHECIRIIREGRMRGLGRPPFYDAARPTQAQEAHPSEPTTGHPAPGGRLFPPDEMQADYDEEAYACGITTAELLRGQ
jgi:hypothetical protein